MADRCEKCGKKIYRPLRAAIHAALTYSGTYGRPMRYYRCPHDSHWFHLTRMRKGSQA